ncbi:Ger(x)C family spore germination protein [Ectobacillus funiculus]|uniref:Ger(x)C family spore germination protein n=1 Tax=Ectobacillus funiculus TaxID=137993 RepID=UPI00101CD1B4|nr:Ger(x)C family spore germination protein [Ectobacillus funiculus]
MINRLILCLSFFLMVGCTKNPIILEDIQFVQSIGYDYVDGDYILGSFSVPLIQSGTDGQTQSGIFKAVAPTNKDLGRIIQGQSPKPIELGRLGIVLYGRELANKTGVFEMLDSIYRDTRINKGVYLAIIDGKAYEVLDHKYPINDTTAKYFIELIEQNTRGYIPKMDVHTFMYRYFGKGMDPFMPLLERKEDKVQVKGVALFKKDRYIDYIGFKQAFVFKMLYEDTKTGYFSIKLKNGPYVNIENISSSVDYKIKNANTDPRVFIYLKLKARVVEGARVALGQKKVIDRIEKEAKNDIEKNARGMVSKFQALKIDPLGIGDRARSQTRKFNFKRWENHYSEIPVEFNIDVQIMQTMSVE